MNPDADCVDSESDESVESNFELWYNNRVRWKYETYSEQDACKWYQRMHDIANCLHDWFVELGC